MKTKLIKFLLTNLYVSGFLFLIGHFFEGYPYNNELFIIKTIITSILLSAAYVIATPYTDRLITKTVRKVLNTDESKTKDQ